MPFTTFQHTAVVQELPTDLGERAKALAAGAAGGDAVSLEPDGHLVAFGRHEELPEVVRVADHPLRIAVEHNAAETIFSIVVNPVRLNEVYGVYTTLSKSSREQGKLLDRIELDHTYQTLKVAADGSELYVGGTMGSIAIDDTAPFEQLGRVEMPDGADQALASLRLIQR
jgi:hypothetical protein